MASKPKEIMSRCRYWTSRNPKKKKGIDSPLKMDFRVSSNTNSRQHAADDGQNGQELIAQRVDEGLDIFRTIVNDKEARNYRQEEQKQLGKKNVRNPVVFCIALFCHFLCNADKTGIDGQLNHPNDGTKETNRHGPVP